MATIHLGHARIKNENKGTDSSMLFQAIKALRGFKRPFWKGSFYLFVILIFFALLGFLLTPFGRYADILSPVYFLVSILATYFLLPGFFGLLHLALQHAQGKLIKSSQVFIYYHQEIMGKLFAITALGVGFWLGLLMIPSWTFRVLILLLAPLGFMIWLLGIVYHLENKIPLISSLLYSSKIIIHHFFKIVILMMAMGISFFIGFLSGLIGFIWIAPWIFNLWALIYWQYSLTQTRAD